MLRSVFMQRLGSVALLATIAFGSASCGEVARSGRAPVQLVIQVLEGASGAAPNTYGTTLFSDVQTMVERRIDGQTVRVPTIYSDAGRATFTLVMKNPTVTGPTPLNQVTITRFRVQYIRADGRNTPGVDVPYGFDGAVTLTVGTGTVSTGFDLVRHQAKSEPPLRNLINGGNANMISTIAQVTFWGVDQAGNEVMATGQMTVNFGDWADPN
jgi:hypothetical protein